MKPQFARAVDPVFNYVLNLLDRIHRGEQPSGEEERLIIRRLLEQAGAHVGTGREWELASYAIVSWIDEMLIDSPWESAEWWGNNVLEVELFKTRLCFEQFYVRAKEAAGLPQRDAVEVFYICMMLGFRGMYGDPQTSYAFIEAHALPPDLETWARQTELSMRVGQDRPKLARPTRQLASAAPVTTRAFPVWCLVAAMIVAAAAAVWHLANHPSTMAAIFAPHGRGVDPPTPEPLPSPPPSPLPSPLPSPPPSPPPLPVAPNTIYEKWPSPFDENERVRLRATATDSQNNTFFAGNIIDDAGSTAAFVAKCDPKRQRLWLDDSLDSPGRDNASLLACGPTGEIYVAGILADMELKEQNPHRVFLACFASTGERKWLRQFTGPPDLDSEDSQLVDVTSPSGLLLPTVNDTFSATTLIVVNDLSTAGGVITVVGNMKEFEGGNATPFVVRWDLDGNVASTHLLRDWTGSVAAAVVDDAGTVYGIGRKDFRRFDQSPDWPVTVFALDAGGNEVWSTDVGRGRLAAADVAMLASGDLVVAATDFEEKSNVFLARLRKGGNEVSTVFERHCESDSIDRACAVLVDNSGTLFVGGSRKDDGDAHAWMTVWFFDGDGRPLPDTRTVRYDVVYGFTVNRLGRLLAVGDTFVPGDEDPRIGHATPFVLELTAPK